jgi:hypothetical protein
MTDFKIGYAPDEFTEIYYTSKISWFGMTNAYGNDVTVADGISSLGFSRYLSPVVPAWFFSAGIALSTWSLPFEDNSTSWQGFGIYGGAGCELAKHMNVELDLIYGNPSHTEGGLKATTNSFTVKFTVNALAY